LAKQTGVSVASVWTAIKLFHIHLYKINVDPEIKAIGYEKRVRFCNLFINHVHFVLLDPKLIFFTDDANFNLRILTHKTTGTGVVKVWCMISANCIIRPIFYEGTLDAERYVNEILNPFFHTQLRKLPQYYVVCLES
jgi:hypothetical protein